MSNTEPLLSVSQLSCVRSERLLFADLSFELHAGQILHVVGPNGAGKSSLLRLLAGLARADSGHVQWRGEKLDDCYETYLAQLLYLGHQPGVKAEMTPLETLAFFAPATTEAQRFAILDQVGLVGYEDVPAAQLSAGQQRRIALARLWVESEQEQHRLWILDEPLTAIDKAGVAELERRFLAHTDAGGSIILTTHQDLRFAADRCQVVKLDGAADTDAVPEVALV